MKRQKFAILDREAAYASSLMGYLAQRQSVPFETLVFDNAESLEEYTGKGTIDLLMVSESMMSDRVRQMNIRRIVVLLEGQGSGAAGCPAVYKYQSSESLVAEVMSCYAGQEAPQPMYFAKRKLQILGVYSPVGRCGKTCFALTLGQILARERRTLYLNLEDYAGFDRLLDRETPSDISDVMYFIRQNRGSPVLKLNSAIQKLGALDYLPPAFSPADLREISLAEWMQLLEELVRCSSYEAVILDIGQAPGEIFSLLAQCSRIYTPVCEDASSQAKLAQYETLLAKLEYDEILERTRELILPFCEFPAGGESALLQLPGSVMGEFVRELLQDGSGEREEWETDKKEAQRI